MDKLSAVNDMLSAIGEDEVATLASGLPDAELAESLLDRSARSFQARGWWFNTDKIELAQENDGRVPVPNNILRFQPLDHDVTSSLTVRGGYFWDPIERTDVFNKNITVEAIIALSWADLPEVFQDYMAVSAGRKFQDRTLGSQKHHQFSQEDETRALALLMEEHVDREGSNMNTDSYSAREIAGRHNNPSSFLP